MEKPRVLVIEDTKITQVVLKSTFEVFGCDVVICDSAEEAWDHLQKGPLPHAIILDFQLPGEDGPSFFRRLSLDPRYKMISVIPFTSLLSQEEARGTGKIIDFVGSRDTLSASVHPMIGKKDGQSVEVPPALILSVGHAIKRADILLPPELRKAMRTIAQTLSEDK